MNANEFNDYINKNKYSDRSYKGCKLTSKHKTIINIIIKDNTTYLSLLPMDMKSLIINEIFPKFNFTPITEYDVSEFNYDYDLIAIKQKNKYVIFIKNNNYEYRQPSRKSTRATSNKYSSSEKPYYYMIIKTKLIPIYNKTTEDINMINILRKHYYLPIYNKTAGAQINMINILKKHFNFSNNDTTELTFNKPTEIKYFFK